MLFESVDLRPNDGNFALGPADRRVGESRHGLANFHRHGLVGGFDEGAGSRECATRGHRVLRRHIGVRQL